MKIYNAFGITPTNSFVSAGSDYYIPDLKGIGDDFNKINKVYQAFEKSYKKTPEEILEIVHNLKIFIRENYKDDNDKCIKYINHINNLLLLYLALHDSVLESVKEDSLILSTKYFLDEFVVYDDKNDKIGIKVRLNDTLFINSGIKVALDTVLSDIVGPNPTHAVDLLRMLGIGVAGLYVNKSGMGNKGWDIRACLVDEDYSGYVHLSMSYTKEVLEDKENIVYCGDKLTQMMLIPVFHTKYEEIDEDKYNLIMKNSERGDSGFGSQDIKH